MRVIGIDPGLVRTGWGVIEMSGNRLRHVANGTCQAKGPNLAVRLANLYELIGDVFHAHAPEAAAVEHTFVNKDAAGTLKLGQARAIALLVPAQAGLDVGEYAPNAVKKAVVGVGHAQKQQVEHMVKLQFPGIKLDGPDAADAIAIAMCHAYHLQSAGKLQAALAKAGA